MLLKGFSTAATYISTGASLVLLMVLLSLRGTREFLKRALTVRRRAKVRQVLRVREERCDFCGRCVVACPAECVLLKKPHVVVDASKCLLCGNCEVVCPRTVFSVEEVRGR